MRRRLRHGPQRHHRSRARPATESWWPRPPVGPSLHWDATVDGDDRRRRPRADEDLDAARRRQLHGRAARAAPSTASSRRCCTRASPAAAPRTPTARQLHHPRADGGVRARGQGGRRLRAAGLRRRPGASRTCPRRSPFCRWIEELARRGVVGGCGGGNYCPTTAVTASRWRSSCCARWTRPQPARLHARRSFADVPGQQPVLPLDRGAGPPRRRHRLRRRQLLPARARHPRADGRLPQRDVRPDALRPVATRAAPPPGTVPTPRVGQHSGNTSRSRAPAHVRRAEFRDRVFTGWIGL